MCFYRCLFRARARGNTDVFRYVNGLWLAAVSGQDIEQSERFCLSKITNPKDISNGRF